MTAAKTMFKTAERSRVMPICESSTQIIREMSKGRSASIFKNSWNIPFMVSLMEMGRVISTKKPVADAIKSNEDERYDLGGFSSTLEMHGININLKTGTVLDNTEILNTDEEFVKDFIKRSNRQNGKNSVAIDGISDREKLQLFQDADSLILFYTPIGLEVGYNYSGVEGYTGWITVSIEEYEQYLKGY